VLTTLWALAGSRAWKTLQKIGVVLLLLLSVAMTALALKTYGWRELWPRQRRHRCGSCWGSTW
jgi:purine-cytosine permease-like protein